MTYVRTFLAIVVAATGFVVMSSTTEAAGYANSIDARAAQLERQASLLIRELNYHYRHTPHYAHLIHDARAVANSAAHVHEVAHHRGGLSHLKADLQKLDRSIHHLDEVMHQVRDHVAYCRNPRCGHFHGDIRPAMRLIHQMTYTVHELKDDVRRAAAVRHRYHHYGHHGIGHGDHRAVWYGSPRKTVVKVGSYNLRHGRHGGTLRFGTRF